MQEHLRAAASRADSYVVLTEAARAAFATGDIETSRTLYAQAVTAARSARVNDIAASLIAEQALGNALVGDTARARGELQQAIGAEERRRRRDDLDGRRWPRRFSAARSRRRGSPQAYQDLEPPAPDIVGVQIPMLRAAAALASNEPREGDCRPEQRGAVRAVRRSLAAVPARAGAPGGSRVLDGGRAISRW